jgi:aspartyl-tRNA(Asn)/glutamyl-tRNA(Gln) amidotransferase subunit B
MNPTSKYKTTIGIECHVQLKTKTKLFAAVAIADYESAPNTAISPICLGMPGALPVLNEFAVELGAKAAFSLNSTPQKFSKFDRKHYFYPDLPKGYQITQFDQPIVLGGYVDIITSEGPKRINITRAHMEEDAGKTIHPPGKNYSLVDLNRAGTPLLEIVSEPDMHTAEEARAFAHELYLLVRYADVSEADLYQGNMRFDVNVSVSASDELGTRTETKNLNSFKSVEKSVDYEVKRQIELLEKGIAIVQETRGWDDAKQKTFSQRSKEDAHDYRYFPDPDLPPIELSDEFIERVKNSMSVTPGQLREKLSTLGLDISAVETLVEAMRAGKFMLEVIEQSDDKLLAKRIANWLTSEVQGLVADNKITWEKVNLNVDSLLELADLAQNNKINSTAAKAVLVEMVISGGNPEKIAQSKNLIQMSDDSAMEDMVKKILEENPKAAEDLKNGEEKVIGFLVGQVMKLSKGQANPQTVQELIKKLVK